MSITFNNLPSFSKSIMKIADPYSGATPLLYPAPNTATHLSLLSTFILIILGVDQLAPSLEKSNCEGRLLLE